MAAAKRDAAVNKATAVRDYSAAFAALRAVFAGVLPKLQVLVDTDKEYTLHTRVASPFKQHKGGPMFFASVRKGKAYASFHLFPLYINEALKEMLSPELQKRMQGKTCFNFKEVPEPELLRELKELSSAGLEDFKKRGLG